MQKLQKSYPRGFTNHLPSHLLTMSSRDICSLKRRQRVTSHVRTVQEKKSKNTCNSSYSSLLSMKRLASELEALACICLASPCSTHIGSKPSNILEKEIAGTLYSSLRTVRYLTDWLIKLSNQTQTKSFGAGDLKQNSHKKLRRS